MWSGLINLAQICSSAIGLNGPKSRWSMLTSRSDAPRRFERKNDFRHFLARSFPQPSGNGVGANTADPLAPLFINTAGLSPKPLFANF